MPYYLIIYCIIILVAALLFIKQHYLYFILFIVFCFACFYAYYSDFFNTIFNKNKSGKYLVKNNDKTLAILSFYSYADMFWNYFTLAPLTDDQVELDKLYSDSFWLGSEIKFIEFNTKKPVVFHLAAKFDSDEEDANFVEYLKQKPQHVLLRGPYQAS